ncbi:MAG TPA: hypothetical protein VK550_14955 [Polyangiaceae bacterium]|nr:hypothetical protein [Polyangiaceae bacterium]
MNARHFGKMALWIAALAGGASCLPADTRPAPGSILLTVVSADEPTTMTADGWSITIDRLLVGMGNAWFGHPDVRATGRDCIHYSDTPYLRLLDARRPTEQKLVIMYGLGPCQFSFNVTWPDTETLLGEGVSEIDKALMAGPEFVTRGGRPGGIAIDFAATATRGDATKRIHWMFRQPMSFACPPPTNGSPPLELRSGESWTFPIRARAVTLFADDPDPALASLRFDAIAAADGASGPVDDEVTLDELELMTLVDARRFGLYPTVVRSPDFNTPSTLGGYVHLLLLPRLVQLREDITCESLFGTAFSPR